MYILISILIMAAVTYITRCLPITLFSKDIKSKYIKAFLNYVPYAVLATMTFPDIFYSTSASAENLIFDDFIIALIGTLIAIILALLKKSLITVAISTFATVIITSYIINL